jgi:transposase
MLENSSKIFEQPVIEKDDPVEKLKEELYKQIGQLRVENEWLKKKSSQFLGQKFS